MSIHTRGPFSWAGGPIGHTSANAGVAANAAAVPSTPRRDIGLENRWLSFGIVVSPGHNLWLACNNRKAYSNVTTSEMSPSGQPSHSITSLALARSDGGTARPNALAVLRLMISSYFFGAWTGR